MIILKKSNQVLKIFIIFCLLHSICFQQSTSCADDESLSKYKLVAKYQDGVNEILVPYLDIINVTIEAKNDLLRFNMTLRGNIPDSQLYSNKELDDHLSYLWFIDIDQNSETGQAHNYVGSEYNVILQASGASPTGEWRGRVDITSPEIPGGGYVDYIINENKFSLIVPILLMNNDQTFDWSITASGSLNGLRLGSHFETPKQTTDITSELLPPQLEVGTPNIDGYKVTIDGVSTPQDQASEIVEILWDWGDGMKENQWFPGSHEYNESGEYAVKVYSILDTGFCTQKEVNVSIDPRSQWDRINLILYLSDDRIDVGEEADLSVSGEYEYNSQPFRGDVAFQGSNKHDDVSKHAIIIDGINDPRYNVTAFTQNIVWCIWDRVKVTEGGVSDTTSNVNEQATIWFKAEYEYDSEAFDGTSGILYVNDEPMLWSTTNSRWELQVTSRNPQIVSYKITDIIDERYGLTTYADEVGSLSVEWIQQGIPGFNNLSIILSLFLTILFIKHRKVH